VCVCVCVCVCSLSYLACNAHSPYCHQWPAPLYNIFQHYLINGTILEKGIDPKLCVLLPIKLFSEKFLISRRNERDMTK